MNEGFWIRRTIDAIAAASEAMFPENDLGAPDHTAVGMVERTLAWMDELPAPQRRLVVLMFVAIELGSPLLGAGLGRFSRLSVARRESAIRKWRASAVHPVRLLGEALKGTLSMIYLSHPDVLRHLGMFKSCEHPEDTMLVEIRKDALKA